MNTGNIHFRLRVSQCLGCGVCADVCTEKVLRLGRSDLTPTWTAARCDGCGICQRECPTGAITVRIRNDAAMESALA